MKTVNYTLSSQKCLEEGWTIRPPSPVQEDEEVPEVFEPEPVDPGSRVSGVGVREGVLVGRGGRGLMGGEGGCGVGRGLEGGRVCGVC